MRYAFAGDRDIAVRVLRFMLEQGSRPMALLIPEHASHAEHLQALVSDDRSGGSADGFVAEVPVFTGREPAQWTDELASLDLDYVIGIHYPHLIPPDILEIPRVGVLNLHPSYLPFNRGWHTPSWSILEETPAGATLHFMEEALDAGDIIHQKSLQICPADTAHTLYRRLKDLEFEVFVESWPDLLSLQPPRKCQPAGEGTSHRRSDLEEAQRLDLDAPTTARDVLRLLRGLTTDRLSEAAYFDDSGVRYRVRVEITDEKP